jgi:hypothetical protein
MVVDLLDVDRDRYVVGRGGHRLLDDPGLPARRERDVSSGEDRERDARALAEPL